MEANKVESRQKNRYSRKAKYSDTLFALSPLPTTALLFFLYELKSLTHGKQMGTNPPNTET